MRVLIFDFEVFAKDVLLGVFDANSKEYTQLWDPEAIRGFYEAHRADLWVGHNNAHYDNLILQAVVFSQDPKEASDAIILRGERPKLRIELAYYDTMLRHFASLKALEAYMGKSVSETQVAFDLPRKLTPEERRLTEAYNRADLDQTYLNLKLVKSEFQLRIDLMKEFRLPLSALRMTEAKIAATVLKAKAVPGIESMPLEPRMYPQMRVESEEAKRFYFGGGWSWRKGSARESVKLFLCGAEHTMAAGGIHAGGKRREPIAYYLDVSGYYNLVMINYGLLPRAIPEEGKELYAHMYREQLRLKKIDPVKRAVYKTILLAVFGAMNNEHCEFYDPNCGDMVRLVGEMFLVDLLEKLEPVAEVIQSNTDGIMVKPLAGFGEADIRAVTDEWQSRTGFTLKFETIRDVVQRDVNNYMYRDADGKIHTKGEAVKHWECPESPMATDGYNSKEPLIISKCVVEYWMNGRKPEDVIAELRKEYRLFQWICKRGSYDSLELRFPDGRSEPMQNVNRVFAGKRSMAYVAKRKGDSLTKYASVPPQAIVRNEAISAKLEAEIDYDYYARRAYERISEFEVPPEPLRLF